MKAKNLVLLAAIAVLAIAAAPYAAPPALAEETEPAPAKPVPPEGCTVIKSVQKTFDIAKFPYKSWASPWKTITGEVLKLPGFDGPVPVRWNGQECKIDGNGDGKFEAKFNKYGGKAVIYLKDADGKPYSQTIAVRLEDDIWEFTRSCVVQASYNRTLVTFIDENSNGVYGEIGVDGVVVGKAKYVTPHSTVVLAGGELVNVAIDAGGMQVSFWQYAGAVGTVNMCSSFKAAGKLVSCILGDGRRFVDVSAYKKGVLLPAGNYKLLHAAVEKGRMKYCRVVGEAMPEIVVTDGAFIERKWGGPFTAKFKYRRYEHDEYGDIVAVEYKWIRVFGSAGEEYTDFGKIPVLPYVFVRDGDTGKEFARGKIVFSSKVHITVNSETGESTTVADPNDPGRAQPFITSAAGHRSVEVRIEIQNFLDLLGTIVGDWAPPIEESR